MDYKKYKFSLWEGFFCLIKGSMVFSFLAFFFYKSLIAVIMANLLLPFYFVYEKKRLCMKRKGKLADEFSETLYSVSTNMMAGLSAENAFKESYKDLIRFYGPKSLMAGEIQWISRGLSVNVTIEDLICELAQRSGVEDIMTFAQVFQSAKRNGGNLKEVLFETASTIREKMRIEREIDVIISEKMFELRIMEVVPFFIVFYISITSPGYFDSLYYNLKGIIIMTISLGVYIGAIALGKRIVNVKV